MTLFPLALILFFSTSPSIASEVSAPLADYGSITLSDDKKGLQLRLSLNAPPFTMYSFRLVNNCQQQKPEHFRTRQPLAGSIITNREGYAQSTRTFHRETIQRLRQSGLNAVVFFVHDHKTLRFLTCSEFRTTFMDPEYNWWNEQFSPLLIPNEESPRQ
ncbi:hypothetical protein AB1A81_09945 [Bdellovibrio bacteriovorus]|uniref:Uncharacterized protein n=1 Tax=Bdellovibrio bacteriovorus (strain ATCC 15356 / DSM 50701 / NCIMB 9529 / HD100) TaxID=264462 RepID=Q6ML50_BDEBA|nr:hypothetical protein [Bdellovibrio bacteriovorus]AHZ84711.1 hypothetical protein EP01_07140 [Bdellovibrio bacteriovorus]BEV68600.1 hypothetical protein Bb109J_c2020 [Bdellovibrio bacteriovorus]CAE80007.1 hypothetical protein predicted by Glimmer/Critica [Bdellovibrio bacteriovorus HD100]